MQEENSELQQRFLRSMQIIAAVLIAGVVIFMGIAVAITQNKDPGPPLLAYIAAGFSVLEVVMWSVVPRIIATGQVRQIAAGRVPTLGQGGQPTMQLPPNATDADRLFAVYQMTMIIGNALLEGAAFFCIVAYIITALEWSLGIAGVLVGLMVVTFPTAGRVNTWVQHQLETIEFERNR